jgi:hydroxyacylglutathione hydrolase
LEKIGKTFIGQGKIMQIYSIKMGYIGTNCFILVNEKTGSAAVIDPGGFDAGLVSEIGKNEIERVEMILLTHGHYDHLLGVYDLKKYTGAKVAIHEDDSGCLDNESESLAFHLGRGVQKYLKPDIVLSDNSSLSLGDIVIDVIHTPGHSRGSVCFVCEQEKTIFTGDTLFKNDVGRTDLPGGSMTQLQKSIKKLSCLSNDYIVYPGHDGFTTMADEKNNNRYMRTLV